MFSSAEIAAPEDGRACRFTGDGTGAVCRQGNRISLSLPGQPADVPANRQDAWTIERRPEGAAQVSPRRQRLSGVVQIRCRQLCYYIITFRDSGLASPNGGIVARALWGDAPRRERC